MDEGPGRAKGLASAGLFAFIAIGVFFVLAGLHAQHEGYWSDRPARPYWQTLVGVVMIVFSSGELLRRWRSRR